MLKRHLPIIFILFVLFISCNSREAQEKQADERLKHINLLITQNALNAAKIEIDSIHLLYPRLVEKRRIAQAFEDTIVCKESARTLAYCDSLLNIKQQEVDAVQRDFLFEKDTVYQKVGNYVYKTQRTENNSSRIYLKTFVDEDANFYLISNFCGSKLEHTSVEVSVDDLFLQTDTIDTSNASNHSFTDDDTRWEAVTFKNQADNGVAAFIAQNASKRIKVTLHGKKNYVYYLAESDKKAISETYHLWVVKKDVAQLQKEIKKATGKIERIKKNHK